MSIKAGLGLGRFPFSEIDNFWRWVELCEHSELDSIWHSDRIMSNVNFMESITMMAALAGATKRIKFGMNSVVLSFRDPVMLAKQCATIDFISGGRLLPSFGIGADTSPEFEAFGFSTRTRGRRANESLEVMTRLWSEDEVTFSGEFFTLDKASINPRPIQKNFPVWVGGTSLAAQKRTARFGTGWISGLQSPERVGEVIAGIKHCLQDTGRTIDDDHYGATFAFRFAEANEAASVPVPDRMKPLTAVGSIDDIKHLLDRFVAAGASKFVAIPLVQTDEDMFDQSQRFINDVLPLLSEYH